jgi:hypothetical protein
MSYIGAQPTTAAFVTDTFSANGSGTVFTLSVAPANTNSILVAVSGVLQDPSTYSVSGTTLTFSAAPPAGTGNISVRFLGIPASGVTTTAYRTVTEFTATAGQTTFTPPSYTVGYINVYRNGALLGTADYTATNGTTVVLASAASSGDLVVVESFYVSSVLNAIPAQNNAVIDSYILSMAGSKLTGTQVIPKATLPTGSVLQVVQTVKTNTFSTASTSFVDVTGLSVSITPTSATSKILVLMDVKLGSDTNVSGYLKILRDSTSIYIGDADGSCQRATYANSDDPSAQWPYQAVGNYLDSPATTSSITYKIQILSEPIENTGTVYINRSGDSSTTAAGGRTASSITVMEIAA